MKKTAYIFPVICLAALSISAKADTLKLVSSNGEVGPYSMQIDGVSESMFCIDDFRTVQNGESWAVTVENGSNYYSTNKSSTDFAYEEEAYILSKETSTNQTAVQDALWAVMDSSDHLSPLSAAGELVTAAYNFTGYTTAFLSGYDFYIPVVPGGWQEPSDWDGNGVPQTFIGQNPDPSPVPEPSTLALFGSGLIGMAGALRRKLARA
jgi:hypothetical protein